MKNILKSVPIVIHIGKYHYHYGDYLPKQIMLYKTNVGWKDKYGEPRFEFCPFILFKFFNFEIRITRTWNKKIKESDADIIYWETLLDITVYHKDFDTAVQDNTWDSLETNKKYNVITLNMVKNKKD